MLLGTNSRAAEGVTTANDDSNPIEPQGATCNQQKSPISHLPTETLISIIHWGLPRVDFTYIFGAISSHRYMRRLYALRQVSKRWQNVIDGTPAFWPVIFSKLPHHVNNATIARSASRSLAVVYEIPEEPNVHNHPSPEEFLNTIVHTRYRWSAVALDVREGEGMSGYLATPAPLLQTVVINNAWDDPYDKVMEPLVLLGGQTAKLRHVEVTGAFLQWELGLFSGLKSLSLEGVGDDLTTRHIIDFLQASPDLEELCLEGSLPMPTSQTPASIITLSHLRSIDLACYTSDPIDYILRRIRAPSCRKFYMNLEAENEVEVDYSRFMQETMKPFVGMLQEIHIENGGSRMSVDLYAFHWYSLAAAQRRCHFSISIRAFCPMGIRWAEEILQGKSGLQYEFTDAPVIGDELGDLAPLRCVTKALVTTRQIPRTHAVLQFLHRPLSLSTSTPSLPCLQELEIMSTRWSALALLEMVQGRRTAFSESTLEQPPLTIIIWREAFTEWNYTPRSIVDLATLKKIRETEGVQCVQVTDPNPVFGTLAITWNEETSKPTWG